MIRYRTLLAYRRSTMVLVVISLFGLFATVSASGFGCSPIKVTREQGSEGHAIPLKGGGVFKSLR